VPPWERSKRAGRRLAVLGDKLKGGGELERSRETRRGGRVGEAASEARGVYAKKKHEGV
jgi:hypothetical protein